MMTSQPYMNPVQWNQALGLARRACADIFEKGGKPQDALTAFKLTQPVCDHAHWGHAITLIAFKICDTQGHAPNLTRIASAA
jgi:hypothetical protein